MKFVDWLFEDVEVREEQQDTKSEDITVSDPLLSALTSDEDITAKKALSIPAFSSAIEKICNIVSLVEIKLYKESNGVVEEVKNDDRVFLLNDETGDTLDGVQFKKALVRDYLLYGNGYAYINRVRNKVKSIHYVECTNVSVTKGVDPIFKTYDIRVNGKSYRNFDFIKLTRNSVDGVKGVGIVEESNKVLSAMYSTMKFERNIAETGGNKKGFLKSAKKLSEEALNKLKEAWRKLYSGNSQENVIILNDGLDFQESSNNSNELQLAERKKLLTDDINSLFNIGANVSYLDFVKEEILPILEALTCALNKDLLLEKEKGSYYFACDTKNIMKADIQARYNAYQTALNSGWLSKNEVRYMEDLEEIEGLDVITLSLGNVLYDIKTGKYYTPNTNSTVKLGDNSVDQVDKDADENEVGDEKGGEDNEIGSENK